MKRFSKIKKGCFINIDLRTDRQEGNIAGTKMKKFLDFFVSELERKQQKVLMKEFYYSGKGKNAKGFLVVKEKKEIEVRGPSKDLEEAVKSFKKSKGKKVFQKGNYWWFKLKISVRDVFVDVLKVEKEMGAGGKIVEII